MNVLINLTSKSGDIPVLVADNIEYMRWANLYDVDHRTPIGRELLVMMRSSTILTFDEISGEALIQILLNNP